MKNGICLLISSQLRDLLFTFLYLVTGTVLAINGYRKYYNIYHPKTVNLRRVRGDGGEFMGFDSDSSDSETEGKTSS